MRICLIAEGSYPYVVGGVSSWIQMLISSMPEHEFVVVAIGANHENRGKFKYKLPDNLIEVCEIFLDTYIEEPGAWGKRYSISQTQKTAIINLISGKNFDWKDIFEFFHSQKNINVSDFLMSSYFYDILSEVAEEKFIHISFNEYFWTMRSMILPLFGVIINNLPSADIYHSVSTGYAGVIASYAKFCSGSPMILTEHGIYTREREEEILKAKWVTGYFKDIWIEYFYNLSRCAYIYADRVICLFSRNKEIQHEVGCDLKKISIIPNGISLENFTELDTPRKDEYFNLGAILRVVPIKDIKTMIHGFKIASEKIKNARLYLMGPLNEDVEYSEECKALAKNLMLDNVIFTGQVNVKDYLGMMDIMLLSSISEGQPLSVLEGMAAGKPHILTDVGSCSELMNGMNDGYGKAGIIVPVMDYEAFGKAIIELYEDEKLTAEMGKNARNRVSRFYKKEMFIECYKNLYKEVLN